MATDDEWSGRGDVRAVEVVASVEDDKYDQRRSTKRFEAGNTSHDGGDGMERNSPIRADTIQTFNLASFANEQVQIQYR